MTNTPKISLCIPTYNNQETIKECLEYIRSQKYPKELIEIIIIDGGSNDNTKLICKNYTDIILDNPHRIEEKGRVIGIKKASGEIIGFIDADNFLADKNFIQKIIMPFVFDQNVVFSEPIYYDSRPNDDKITKYISLIGADDPLAVYFGLYDRFCYFTKRWTESPCQTIIKNKDFKILKLEDLTEMPPFGANGSFIKKDKLLNVKYDPFIHTDIIYQLLKNKNLFAKVNVAVVHKQNGSLISFLKKKIRRGTRNYKDMNRKYYFKFNKTKAAIFIIKSLLVFPLFLDCAIGYKNKKSYIWLWHPVIVISTLFVYLLSYIKKYGVR